MALLDLLGRRWTLRILWELHQSDESLTFRSLRERCAAMSSSVLTTRLGELRDTQLLTRTDHGYALTSQGRALIDVLAPLNTWADIWARELQRPSDTERW